VVGGLFKNGNQRVCSSYREKKSKNKNKTKKIKIKNKKITLLSWENWESLSWGARVRNPVDSPNLPVTDPNPLRTTFQGTAMKGRVSTLLNLRLHFSFLQMMWSC